jgi:transposase-like protein
VLGLFIGLMNGQDASKGSSWHKMEQVIKIAISAWPIVFAAVVAQGRYPIFPRLSTTRPTDIA